MEQETSFFLLYATVIATVLVKVNPLDTKLPMLSISSYTSICMPTILLNIQHDCRKNSDIVWR